MNNFKSIYILFALFFFSLNIYAQKNIKEITIHYFSKLSDNDVEAIEKIKNGLFGKNGSKKNKYKLKLKNIYTGGIIDLNKDGSAIDNFNYDVENLTLINTKHVIEKIQEFNLPNIFTYKTDINTEVKFGVLCKDIRQLLKLIKKNKENNLNIIWPNGFVPYKYSVENIKRIYQEHSESNEISKIIPKIIHPSFKEQLLPDENGYVIEFDSVGCFPEYEIEINSTSEKNKGQFVKQHLKFSQNEEHGKDIFMYYTGDGKLCKIYISQTSLGKICLKMSSDSVNVNEVPTDEDCNECRNKCLYPTRFELKIRGYVTGYTKDDLWSDFVPRFSFQCPSHN